MSIWIKNISIHEINQLLKNTLCEHLNICMTEKTDNQLIGTMPVDSRTHQTFGRLHGGASVVLAETLGSIAGNLCVPSHQVCVGLEINANHLLPVFSGLVTGKATPLHTGRSTQVWEIKLYRDDNRLCCISRHTVSIIEKSVGGFNSTPSKVTPEGLR